MGSIIVILQRNMFRYGTIANTDFYSSEFSEINEADKLHPSYNPPHEDLLTPDTVSAFGGR